MASGSPTVPPRNRLTHKGVPMKYFNCSDLVDGCDVVFRGLDADGIAGRASEHAEKAHGLTGVTDRILAAVH